MAKKKKVVKEEPEVKKKKKVEKAIPTLDLSALYNDDIDVIAMKQGYEESSMEGVPPMSSGLLALDLALGGGIRPAWYTMAGGEQSAKTTSAITIMGASVKEGVPIVSFSDYEGSSSNSLPYLQSIMKGIGASSSLSELFGKKDGNTGKWVVRPKVRYRTETLGEKFFDFMAEVLRTLPDKRFINNQWWYVFDDTKPNKARLGDSVDNSMAKKYGKGLWVPAPDGKLQAIFLVDSYPAMNPSANDDDEANNSLALQARMFSKHLPRVKGRMAQKMVAVIGVNQIRAVPMAMYGPKEQEPGGTALKFYSDVRLKNTSRGSGYPLWAKTFDKEYFENEKSVNLEGTDRYRYIHAKAIKNKLGVPQRQVWYRLWHADAGGEARGFDPFFDTMFYLRETGQLTGSGRDKLTLKLDGLDVPKKPIKWLTFKRWVLGTRDEMKAISAEYGFKPMSLRAFCFKQMATGKAESLYTAHHNSKAEDEEEE